MEALAPVCDACMFVSHLIIILRSKIHVRVKVHVGVGKHGMRDPECRELKTLPKPPATVLTKYDHAGSASDSADVHWQLG
jgi:hypothetical protein